MGSRSRGRTEAHLAGADGGPQLAFGQGMLRGPPPVVGPVREAVDMGPEALSA